MSKISAILQQRKKGSKIWFDVDYKRYINSLKNLNINEQVTHSVILKNYVNGLKNLSKRKNLIIGISYLRVQKMHL